MTHAILPFLQRTFSFALLALHTVALRRPSSRPHAPSRGAFARTVPRASLLRLTAALPTGAFALAQTLRVRRIPVHFPTVIMSWILRYTHKIHTKKDARDLMNARNERLLLPPPPPPPPPCAPPFRAATSPLPLHHEHIQRKNVSFMYILHAYIYIKYRIV